jgi:hypothetical protein
MGILLGALGGAGEGLATYAKGEQAKDSQLEIDKQRSQLEEEKAKRIAQFQQELDISGIGKRSAAQLDADKSAQPTRLEMASTASKAANSDVVNNTVSNANNQELVDANLKKQRDEAAGNRQKAIDDAKAFADPEFIKNKTTATAADAESKQTSAEKNLKNAQAGYYATHAKQLKTAIADAEAMGKIPAQVKIQLTSLQKQLEKDSEVISKAMADGTWQETIKDKDGKEIQNPLRQEYAIKLQRVDDLLKKGDSAGGGLPENLEPQKPTAAKPTQKPVAAAKDPLAVEKDWITKRNGFTDEKDLKKFLKDNPDLSPKMKLAAEELLQARVDSTKNFQAGFETPL